MPICHLTLNVQRPPPEGYPKELKTLGDHIKRKRLDLDLTQEQLAQTLKVHPRSIGVWEGNLKEPKPYLMPRIIDFLGYSLYRAPESLADWIRTVRRANGLSQERLAEALGMDESTVQKWEAGKHRPFRSSLRRVKGFLRSIT